MRARDFDQATPDQLFDQADLLIQRAEIDSGQPVVPDDIEKLRLLYTAQFYLAAVARKQDEKTSRRDLILEIVVIALISIEIILSLFFGFQGLREGKQQADILDKMNTSLSTTSESIKQLASDQAKSRENLEQMNDKLQHSLAATSDMATALKAQLSILRSEQENRLAVLSKKPHLALYIGNIPADTAFKLPYPQREITDTSVSFDCAFLNEGDAIATRPLLRVVFEGKDVSVTSSTGGQPAQEPVGSEIHTFLIPMDNMRSHIRIPFVLTFNFPKGQKPFQVLFNADADEIETGTRVGSMSITPRKPLD